MTDTTQDTAANETAPDTTTTAPAEPKETTAETQAETAAEAADTEEEAASTEDPGADTADESQPKKSKGGFQKRIDKLTTEKHEEARARQDEARKRHEAELRAQAAERKLAEMSRQQAGSLDAEPGPQPKLEEFTTVDAYNEAITAWAKREGYQQAKKESNERKQQQDFIAARAALGTRVDEARKKYADYDQVIGPVSEIVDSSPVLSQYTLESEMAPEVGYHLGKNPAVLLDILKKDDFGKLRELAKIEARLSAAAPPKSLTKAPDPIKPVGQSEKAPFSLETAGMEEFARRRNEEERKQRKG